MKLVAAICSHQYNDTYEYINNASKWDFSPRLLFYRDRLVKAVTYHAYTYIPYNQQRRNKFTSFEQIHYWVFRIVF